MFAEALAALGDEDSRCARCSPAARFGASLGDPDRRLGDLRGAGEAARRFAACAAACHLPRRPPLRARSRRRGQRLGGGPTAAHRRDGGHPELARGRSWTVVRPLQLSDVQAPTSRSRRPASWPSDPRRSGAGGRRCCAARARRWSDSTRPSRSPRTAGDQPPRPGRERRSTRLAGDVRHPPPSGRRWRRWTVVTLHRPVPMLKAWRAALGALPLLIKLGKPTRRGPSSRR